MTKLPFTANELHSFLVNAPNHQVANCYVMAALLNDFLKQGSMQLEVSTRKGCFNTPVTGVAAALMANPFNTNSIYHGLQFQYTAPEHDAVYCQMQVPTRHFLRMADARNVSHMLPLTAEDVHNGRAYEGRCALTANDWDSIRELYAIYMDLFILATNKPFSKNPKVFHTQEVVFDRTDSDFPTANLLRVVSQSAPFLHEGNLVDTIVENHGGNGFKYIHSSDLLSQAEYHDCFSLLATIHGGPMRGEKNEWLFAVHQSMPDDYHRDI